LAGAGAVTAGALAAGVAAGALAGSAAKAVAVAMVAIRVISCFICFSIRVSFETVTGFFLLHIYNAIDHNLVDTQLKIIYNNV
jgi:hypothetical protein